MTPDNVLDPRLSVMTLAVAADSGWFVPDFGKADSYFWGKNKGCVLFDLKCPRDAISEFCNVVHRTSCSDDFKYIRICKRNRFSKRCKVNLNDQNCKKPRKRTDKAFRYGRFSICQNCQVTQFLKLN